MYIKEITHKDSWENFLSGAEKQTFLHSWAWGEFSRAMGEKIWRWGMYEGKELFGVALIIKVNARRGQFLFVPHGPTAKISNFQFPISNKFPNPNFQSLKRLVSELKKLAKEEGCSFIRISPVLEDTEGNREIFRELGFRPAPMHMHAELTWLLDISKSEEELLAGMRKTTRNLVKRGEREGVIVEEGTLDEFYPLFEETAKRQTFIQFSREYLQKEKDAFGKDALIMLAKHENKLLAGAFAVFYGNSAYYHHAASTHSKIPAAYTLQWEIIKEAKRRGMRCYNFWGVVPEGDTSHPWWGLSLFKRGFGGEEWNLMHAQDLPLSWKYYISWSIEKVRKWKRGY